MVAPLSPARRALGVASLVSFLLLAAVAGAVMVATADGTWWASGVGLLVTVAASLWVLVGPRRVDAPVRVTRMGEEAALLLPARPGHVAALCLATVAGGVAFTLVGVGLVADGYEASGRRSPLALVVAGVPLVGLGLRMTWRAARGGGRVLLTGRALVVTGLAHRDLALPWSALLRVAPGPLVATSLSLVVRDGHPSRRRGGPLALPSGRLAWRGEQSLEVLQWFDRDRDPRRVLERGDPAEVEALSARVTEQARAAQRR